MDNTSANLTLEAMMAAGMHLGHSASIWNPMNLPFIFGERQGIHIINLEHTMAALRRAAAFVRNVAYNGGIIVFAGKRKAHAQMAIDAALLSDQYFVSGRWTPGTLTNSRKIFSKHYSYAKEEAKEEQKMFKPDLVIVLSPLESKTMLMETRISHVPTVGVVDTNCDPRLVTYPIPCNDDSLRGMRIVTGVLARAARAGMDLRRERLIGAVKDHETSFFEKEHARKAIPLSPELLN
ncbi:ribosomal protein S2 [Coemansia reversa NRRL 1564]|uniref:Ribosomal protein S2 n=1 Tax=Coemansia reversa (strain ATCC 12441 / NRRL 1564) TaxID=763665 RepID=A0A2G5BEX8_COERN|nr:ribosomal protein S2 [Coemansia reversa NRRL 1564]|eukprot:PIA17570.1 ribosomal protein S2 [Coemansia reversa NRRL 1564]